jgi:hypothetical protein
MLTFGFVIFWRKDFGAKAAHKMLVKLTPGNFLGNGKFTISFGDFCVAGITMISMEDKSKEKILKLWELDSAIRSEKVHYDFKNLVRVFRFRVTQTDHSINIIITQAD